MNRARGPRLSARRIRQRNERLNRPRSYTRPDSTPVAQKHRDEPPAPESAATAEPEVEEEAPPAVEVERPVPLRPPTVDDASNSMIVVQKGDEPVVVVVSEAPADGAERTEAPLTCKIGGSDSGDDDDDDDAHADDDADAGSERAPTQLPSRRRSASAPLRLSNSLGACTRRDGAEVKQPAGAEYEDPSDGAAGAGGVPVRLQRSRSDAERPRQRPKQRKRVARSTTRRIPREEVMAHNTLDSCWITAHGKVYDVTSYVASLDGFAFARYWRPLLARLVGCPHGAVGRCSIFPNLVRWFCCSVVAQVFAAAPWRCKGADAPRRAGCL